jgi:hypothetical protein
MSPRISIHVPPNGGVGNTKLGFLVQWDSAVFPIVKKFCVDEEDREDDSLIPTTLFAGRLFNQRLPRSFDPRVLFSSFFSDCVFGVGDQSITSLDLNRPDSSTTRIYTAEDVKAIKVSNYCNTGLPRDVPLIYQAGGNIFYTLYDERAGGPIRGEVHKSVSTAKKVFSPEAFDVMRVSDEDCNPEGTCPLRLYAMANSAIKEFRYCKGYQQTNVSTDLQSKQCHEGLKAKQLIISCNGWFVVATYERCIHILRYLTDSTSVKREGKSGHNEKVLSRKDYNMQISAFVKCEFDNPRSTNPRLLFVFAKLASQAQTFVSTVHLRSLLSDRSQPVVTTMSVSSTNRAFVPSATCWNGNLWYPTDSCEGVIAR